MTRLSADLDWLLLFTSDDDHLKSSVYHQEPCSCQRKTWICTETESELICCLSSLPFQAALTRPSRRRPSPDHPPSRSTHSSFPYDGSIRPRGYQVHHLLPLLNHSSSKAWSVREILSLPALRVLLLLSSFPSSFHFPFLFYGSTSPSTPSLLQRPEPSSRTDPSSSLLQVDLIRSGASAFEREQHR